MFGYEDYELAELIISHEEEQQDARRQLIEKAETEINLDLSGLFNSLRNRYASVRENAEHHNKRSIAGWQQAGAMRKLREADLAKLHEMTADQVNDFPQIGKDSEEAKRWYGFIARAGILAGNADDVARLLRAIDSDGHPVAWEAFEETREALTTNESYPEPVAIEQAVANAKVWGLSHPLTPHLHEFWKWVWEQAKSTVGLCEVFDQMALALGLPEQWQPTREGGFMAYGSYAVPIWRTGVPYGEDPEISLDEIIEAMETRHLELDSIEEE